MNILKLIQFNSLLDEQRIIHTMKSLWWFYINLPLCKAVPHNFEDIREKYPAIVREKVIELISDRNNDNSLTNIDTLTRVMYKNGSGRILQKSLSSFIAQSRSFDEGLRDTNNNNCFRRANSTTSLSALRYTHAKLLASREA